MNINRVYVTKIINELCVRLKLQSMNYFERRLLNTIFQKSHISSNTVFKLTSRRQSGRYRECYFIEFNVHGARQRHVHLQSPAVLMLLTAHLLSQALQHSHCLRHVYLFILQFLLQKFTPPLVFEIYLNASQIYFKFQKFYFLIIIFFIRILFSI